MGTRFHNTGASSSEEPYLKKEYITIHNLIDNKELQLTLLTSQKSGLDNKISSSKIERLRFPVAHYNETIIPESIMLLEKKKLAHIYTQKQSEQVDIFTTLSRIPVSCFLITENKKSCNLLIEIAEKKKKPVLYIRDQKLAFILPKIIFYLKTQLSKEIFVHGTFLNILGLGVLLIGKSGIGKSEGALALISLGHQLIADDVVKIRVLHPYTLVGTAPSLIRYHMEIRGLGIINILELFGSNAVMEKKEIDLIISMEKWVNDHEYDRLGSDQLWIKFLGVTLPLIRLPVAPGRHIGVIIEAGVRRQLLIKKGINPARELEKKIIHNFCP
ncbi:MAG: HPr(Ser) kinase/phosphatase [bacterium]